MKYTVTLPARINILGNPADANEGAHATISTAIDIRGGAFLEEVERLTIQALIRDENGEYTSQELVECESPPLRYDGHLDLVKAAINRLRQYSAEFRGKSAFRQVKISTWTDVLRQSGLGGSSLLVLATLAGLRAFYELDPLVHNDYLLAELCQRAEALELGITCGFADRYVPLLGGLAYLDYRGKTFHRPLGEEPYVTYEKLDSYVTHLPLIIAYTGVRHDSGDVHGQMRPRYLEEYRQWQQGREKPFMVQTMASAGDTAWRGKIALLEGKWAVFGELMKENHRLVNEMMHYCGFDQGVGWANNLLIDTALRNGALGAKLTGAGGGGSVFALVEPGQEERMIRILRQRAQEAGLSMAQVFQCRIAHQGLTVHISEEV